jgi:hypothetical protein
MKTFKSLFFFVVYNLWVGTNAAHAFTMAEKFKRLPVGEVIPGYNCMDVIYPPEADYNPRLLPPVFAAPTENSRQIGTQGALAYVVWPINEVNGFIELLRFDGETGWIASKYTKPFTYPKSTNTPGRCTLNMTAGGYIGFKGYSLTKSK